MLDLDTILSLLILAAATYYFTFAGSGGKGRVPANPRVRTWARMGRRRTISRYDIAMHEAAHAYAWRSRHGRLGSIHIDSKGGATQIKEGWLFGPSLNNRAINAEVSLAGVHVHSQTAGKNIRAELDTQSFEGGDADHFRSATRSHGRYGRYKRKVGYWSHQLDRRGVNAENPAIQALAGELVRRGQVSGSRAQRILDRHS